MVWLFSEIRGCLFTVQWDTVMLAEATAITQDTTLEHLTYMAWIRHGMECCSDWIESHSVGTGVAY